MTSRRLTPNAKQRMIDQHLENAPEYIRHGGEHPGTKSAEDDAARRRKRKQQNQSRKRARK
jgi:hypothetical protein